MSRTFRILLPFAVLAVAPLAGQSPQSPAQTPTFRVDVNYVEIDARATDAQGNFVGDLTENDFHIVEDGAPQAIKVFTRVNLPVERQDAPLFKTAPIEADVRSNREEFNGRGFVLVLDDLQTDSGGRHAFGAPRGSSSNAISARTISPRSSTPAAPAIMGRSSRTAAPV